MKFSNLEFVEVMARFPSRLAMVDFIELRRQGASADFGEMDLEITKESAVGLMRLMTCEARKLVLTQWMNFCCVVRAALAGPRGEELHMPAGDSHLGHSVRLDECEVVSFAEKYRYAFPYSKVPAVELRKYLKKSLEIFLQYQLFRTNDEIKLLAKKVEVIFEDGLLGLDACIAQDER